MNKPIMAVITGDIVDSQSTTASEFESLITDLEQSFDAIQQIIPARFEIFRGDSFQGLFENPLDSILSTIIIRLTLRTKTPAFDVRQSVGIGAVSSYSAQLGSSMGEAFILSGKGLDAMKSERLTLYANQAAFEERVQLATQFLDAHLSGLARGQSEALLAYLLSPYKTHKVIADHLGKSISNTTKLLNAARYHLVMDYLAFFEQSYLKEYGS